MQTSSDHIFGFSEVCFFQGVGDINIFLSIAKQRISGMFLQTWSNEMENTTRGRSYRLFSSFKFQPYLNEVNISKFRMALTRFKVSVHRLEVEARRWHKHEKIKIEHANAVTSLRMNFIFYLNAQQLFIYVGYT